MAKSSSRTKLETPFTCVSSVTFWFRCKQQLDEKLEVANLSHVQLHPPQTVKTIVTGSGKLAVVATQELWPYILQPENLTPGPPSSSGGAPPPIGLKYTVVTLCPPSSFCGSKWRGTLRWSARAGKLYYHRQVISELVWSEITYPIGHVDFDHQSKKCPKSKLVTCIPI